MIYTLSWARLLGQWQLSRMDACGVSTLSSENEQQSILHSIMGRPGLVDAPRRLRDLDRGSLAIKEEKKS